MAKYLGPHPQIAPFQNLDGTVDRWYQVGEEVPLSDQQLDLLIGMGLRFSHGGKRPHQPDYAVRPPDPAPGVPARPTIKGMTMGDTQPSDDTRPGAEKNLAPGQDPGENAPAGLPEAPPTVYTQSMGTAPSPGAPTAETKSMQGPPQVNTADAPAKSTPAGTPPVEPRKAS